jgi:amino acid adenylation domain-containing protein
LNAAQLHAHLLSLGIEVAVEEGGKLRVRAKPGVLTVDVQQAIAARRVELLELLADRPKSSLTSFTALPRGAAHPLSLFQERLWVLHRLDPANTAYNMVTVWPSSGPADPLQQARTIREVVRRHEILRSTFRDAGGVPEIHLLPAEAVHIETHDLGTLEEAERREQIGDAIAAATKRPFDLTREAPVRFEVYRLDSARLAVLMAAHHIAVDAWSLMLLRREIVVPGCAPAATEAPLQYKDFAAWQRRMLDKQAAAAALQWWERNLAGIPQLCSFPADHAGSERGSGSSLFFRWDKALSDGIRQMVREEGATTYMALLAACALVLQLHARLDDIVFGSPMGVRERSEFEAVIGPFVTLLVLRIDLTNASTFAEVLARARDAVLDAHAHGNVPFEMIVERLKPARSLTRSPIFQVAVVQHNASDEESGPIHGGGAIHDLTWFVREVEGRLEGSLEYRDDLYRRETIERIATHLEHVMRAVVEDPRRPISDISVLGAEERHAVLERFNATDIELDGAPFAQQFERQAKISSAACAARFAGEEITYEALNCRANKTARYLRSLGVGPGAVVGVCLDRSLELLVALIAVQKSGAAYVPLDPAFPPERLTYMLEDSGASALIRDERIAGGLVVPAGVELLELCKPARTLAGIDAADLESSVVQQDLAYVIYTSGSTGKSKGVAISHGALSNFLGAMRARPGLASTDCLAAVTTISFDIAGLELYLPLTVGARIELVPRETATNGGALARLIEESGATVLHATPVTWRLLVDARWRAPTGFRAFCGGETLPRDLAEALLDRVDALWNLYGPTETTIWSTAGRVERGAGPVSIGRPIANTQVYLLDRLGRPVPVGVPGEIWIGGAGVALGYHRRPELTAERFGPNPFASQREARIYRTGDLAQWGPGGQLYHLGRIDRQVKLRGLRIEPGEIEAEICTHPAVRQAVVVALEAEPGNSRLVAYVVYRLGEDLTASELRAHVRRQLPDYMVPSVIVAVDAIPLTSNGKVDRSALPNPFRNSARDATRREPPAPGMEKLMAEIWCDVLKIDRIGAEDNFFELGGDSLMTLRVAAMVEKRAGWRMDPRALFLQNLRQVAAAAGGGRALSDVHAR